MPIEELINEYEKQEKIILSALKNQKEILAQIESSKDEEYDWISVKSAAQKLEISLPVLYNKINKGELSVKYIESKKYVKKSELFKINDKYSKNA